MACAQRLRCVFNIDTTTSAPCSGTVTMIVGMPHYSTEAPLDLKNTGSPGSKICS